MKTGKLLLFSGLVGVAIHAAPGYAVNGHYVGGLEGIRNASVPPEGVYYRGYIIHYDIDSIQDPDGNTVPGDNSGSVSALSNRLVWITGRKFLGADYGMEAIVNVQRNDFEFAGLGIDRTETGIGDVFLGPVVLGWHGEQWDSVFAAGHWFDTSDYASTNPVSVGKGFGTTMLTLGGTWHLDPARSWSFSALSRYEIKTEQDDTGVTPGDSWIVEWAISHQLDNGLDVALVGYDGWQLESDSGAAAGNGKVEQHGIGVEVALGLPAMGAMLNAAVYTEYRNRNRPEGSLFRLSLTKPF